MRIWVDRGGDLGSQWITADPNAEGHPAELGVSDFSKEMWYPVGNNKGEFQGDPLFRYWVTVTNRGDWAVHFTVQGGGNV